MAIKTGKGDAQLAEVTKKGTAKIDAKSNEQCRVLLIVSEDNSHCCNYISIVWRVKPKNALKGTIFISFFRRLWVALLRTVQYFLFYFKCTGTVLRTNSTYRYDDDVLIRATLEVPYVYYHTVRTTGTVPY